MCILLSSRCNGCGNLALAKAAVKGSLSIVHFLLECYPNVRWEFGPDDLRQKGVDWDPEVLEMLINCNLVTSRDAHRAFEEGTNGRLWLDNRRFTHVAEWDELGSSHQNKSTRSESK